MLFSLALLFLIGMLFGKIFEKLKLPKLVGMLITGIILGPYLLNLLDEKILAISPELRRIALIIILLRAGLNLDIKDLKKAGRPAALLCFLPASIEIIGMMIFAPKIFGVSIIEAAIMGAVVAAVSPAVVVPRMLNLMDRNIGKEKAIPQMIMAGASVDDIFVIVLFTAFLGMEKGGTFEASKLIEIPSSIIVGIIVGIIIGYLLSISFKKYHLRDTGKVIILLSIAFILVTIEDSITGNIGFSGLLAIMAIGATMKIKLTIASERLSLKFSKLWYGAEILLFVLVGAEVNIGYALKAGTKAILLIFIVMCFRMLGVFLSVFKTKLNNREKLFTAFAYMPKATVQAAIGGIPLAMGLACGDMVLTVAVLAILITAPLGAFLIDRYTGLLID
ncbi:MAG: cation:proton antiporter [Tissierellia bacterium]|nr:cation:proton antiporter [Tissierellia bacterium]